MCASDGRWTPDPAGLKCNGEMNVFSMQIIGMLMDPVRTAGGLVVTKHWTVN